MNYVKASVIFLLAFAPKIYSMEQPIQDFDTFSEHVEKISQKFTELQQKSIQLHSGDSLLSPQTSQELLGLEQTKQYENLKGEIDELINTYKHFSNKQEYKKLQMMKRIVSSLVR